MRATDVASIRTKQKNAWMPVVQKAAMLTIGLGVSAWIGKTVILRPEWLLQASILILILIPGFILAATNSSKLISYVILIWLVGPEIRRLMDWAVLGSYSTLTLLSLSPVLTTSLLALPLLRRDRATSRKELQALKAFMLPFIYAGAIGVLLNKLAGFYGVLNYFAPLFLFFYMMLRKSDDRERAAWIRFYVTMGSLLSIYAWFQYLYLPAWDKMWIEGAKMVSLGPADPMMFKAFSTLNANGAFSIFLVSAIMPAIINRKWRGPFGWAGILLMISALSITLVRASWIVLIIEIVLYVLLASGASRLRMISIVGVLVVAGFLVFPHLPGGDALSDRISTMGNLKEDASANARLLIVLNTIPDLISHPLGSGFGGIGRSTLLNGGSTDFSSLASVDNGYLGVFATFGLLGGVLVFRAMYLQGRLIHSSGTGPFRTLGLITLFGLLASFFFGGELATLQAVIFWLFTGLALGRIEDQDNVASKEELHLKRERMTV
ncbi:O-antigen ligase family protein [Cohnella hashimotonis]|uniref:O-antigen ligase family protein n=1 Tax=Cohnella hashimotonis TaxID=2826895 RepID=A0ABT6TBH1_9BACL|nr:O-antigen ligase family protein [Cohnella hashimotonis]MDI4644160.1 O-antigen ligase family protein [Cohnella hashimotonis]